MGAVLLRASVVWIFFVCAAILNGFVREGLLVPLLGRKAALPASGCVLAGAILLLTALTVPLLRASTTRQYWIVGLAWAGMTVVFEFVFGRWVLGTPWSRLLEAYNILSRDLWLLVLLATAAAPYVGARIRGLP